MITHVRVRSFQSLRQVDLALGPFTCIVGPSNSGKSALLRALRALALNVSSPSIVTHGAKVATIEATVPAPPDRHEVKLTRGKAKSEYQLDGEAYPKSGTKVPGPVVDLLKLDELNFAFQFDRPFLLADPPTKAAQVLGELTNVTVIYDAVREANRRRLEVSGRLKVRRGDQEVLEDRAREYVGLKDRKGQLDAIRVEYDAVQAMVDDAERLQSLTAIVIAASAVVAGLDGLPELPDVDLGSLETMATQTERLSALIFTARRSGSDAILAARDVDRLEDERDQHEAKIRDLLVAAGTCPMCGQTVEEEHVH